MERQENSYTQGKRDFYIQKKSDPQLENSSLIEMSFIPSFTAKILV